VFVESSGPFGSPGAIRPALAIANTEDRDIEVSYALFDSGGLSTGLTGSIPIVAEGFVSLFVGEFPGLGTMPADFSGTLALDADGPIAVTALRGRWNERGEFLYSAAEPAGETLATPTLAIPHFAFGGGYETEFVLFAGDDAAEGTVKFFGPLGDPIPPPVAGTRP
jgi:hypothetical protein